jgi:hypothetical protein
VAGVLVVRTLRRAVIVSPFGLEARRTFFSWRLPWSVVESFAVEDPPGQPQSSGPLTVVLVDGSTRSARVGRDQHGEPSFARVAEAARRHPQVRSRGYLGRDSLFVLFILAGVALLVACAVADIGRSEHEKLSALRTTTAKQLRDLEGQIATGDGFAVALFGIVVITGVAAVVFSRRSRGVPPIGRWPTQFPHELGGSSWPPPSPDAPGSAAGSLPPPGALVGAGRPLAIPPVIICRNEGVYDADGTMLAAISHRRPAGTEIDTYTYWSTRTTADFSLQTLPVPTAMLDGTLSTGVWWLVAGWTVPVPGYLHVTSDGSGLVLHGPGSAGCRLLVDVSRAGYVAFDENGRTLATFEPASPGWRCMMSSDLPQMTRRLLCVAALLADERAGQKSRSSRPVSTS